jgi:adenylosuccinate lyase
MGQNCHVSNLSPQPISPLDGRYRATVAPLADYFSEAALNKVRIQIEVEWLIWLVEKDLLGAGKSISEAEKLSLRKLYGDFDDTTVSKLQALEKKTRHDVKAIEYFIREKLSDLGRSDLSEMVHFALTSEDVNNLSYAINIRDGFDNVWIPAARWVTDSLREMAKANADVAMLSRTHGQPATPTTLGKELAVFVHRLERQLKRIDSQPLLGKFSGATGTFAAHYAASPTVDWLRQSEEFLKSLGVELNQYTTQIESHDWQSELFQKVSHFNRILHNLATDIWTYISLGYFKQTPPAGSTGSSTMPHKINPIRFENAESNLELANAVLDSLASTLTTSRMQRDLTDSSAQRNIGVGVAHSLLAIENIRAGLGELAVNEAALTTDLLDNWEVLAEAIQTVVRAEVARGNSKIEDPYALLKELTRGKRVDQEQLLAFINGLDISQAAKDSLLKLRPQTYVGISYRLAKDI